MSTRSKTVTFLMGIYGRTQYANLSMRCNMSTLGYKSTLHHVFNHGYCFGVPTSIYNHNTTNDIPAIIWLRGRRMMHFTLNICMAWSCTMYQIFVLASFLSM